MNHNDKTNNLLPVREAFSSPRLQTYENAVGKTLECSPDALDLYMWNAKVSGAMLTQLHICEVVVRNAVSEALSSVYGPKWPRNTTFVRSLPTTTRPSNYSQKVDLLRTRERFDTTGKVIPELKFVFWQKMLNNGSEITTLLRQRPAVLNNDTATVK